MKIAIASGKGGTGKTTVSLNLALALSEVQLFDCDVEEPNCNLFLGFELEKVEDVSLLGTCNQFRKMQSLQAVFGLLPL